MLRIVADRLTSVAGPGAILGRLAGDRFGMLLTDSGLTQAAATFEGARDALSRPVLVGERTVPIGASIGVTSRGDGNETGDNAGSA